MAVVRYIVSDVSAAIQFYTEQLGFELKINPAPGFAILARDDLRLMLNAPGAGGAGARAEDGSDPAPGGWSRFQIEVADIDAEVDRLRAAGCNFRTGVVEGNGGKQALVEDPSGNVVELLEPPADQRG
jgi:catechol 2,3-dioxygenase-like lactoylglutathione lyase family enzyme